jgi:hypothetical protein
MMGVSASSGTIGAMSPPGPVGQAEDIAEVAAINSPASGADV